MSSEIAKILSGCINKVVLIKLRNNQIIQGKLQTFDEHLNLILMDSEDITDDKVKNLNKIILRGDNVLIISLPKK
ncbi:MAG: putative snRNP Sm-like protein [Nitrosopumilales archaeon]|nr:MAG: putative snRNP Sm-like protein [Nitrosopumilales archaeon]